MTKTLIDKTTKKPLKSINGVVQEALGSARTDGNVWDQTISVSLKDGKKYDLVGFAGVVPSGAKIILYMSNEDDVEAFYLPKEKFSFITGSPEDYEFKD